LLGVFLYGNVLIENYFGSSLPSGSISALGYARRINEVVLTLIAANIARAVFPTLARCYSEGTGAAAREIVHQIGAVMLFWLVPVSAGLVVFSEDVVRLAFMRGAFDAHALELTSGALRYYSLGLLFSSGTLILIRLSYATMDVYLPLKAAAAGISCMVGSGIILKGLMGVSGISLAVSLAALVTFSALFLLLRPRDTRLSLSRLGRVFLLTVGSAAVASIAFVVGPGKALSLFIKGPVFCALYFGLCFAVLRDEARQAMAVLRGKMGTDAETGAGDKV
jgi:putative peptidoglycan lipid II flippase